MEVDAELQARLDKVESQLQAMQGEMLQSIAESLSYVERFKLLEATDARHEDDLRELKTITRGMQKQFDQLGNKIDTLEIKLFSWLQQLQKDNTALLQATQSDNSKERQSNLKSWMTFLQIVLGGTIFIMVAYIFSSNFR